MSATYGGAVHNLTDRVQTNAWGQAELDLGSWLFNGYFEIESAERAWPQDVVRSLSNPKSEFRNSHARTPHHLLNGTITPNALHFSINHCGIPDIDPAKHKLVIHGMVRQPLEFTLESLSRYPLVSRMAFVECAGNSASHQGRRNRDHPRGEGPDRRAMAGLGYAGIPRATRRRSPCPAQGRVIARQRTA